MAIDMFPHITAAAKAAADDPANAPDPQGIGTPVAEPVAEPDGGAAPATGPAEPKATEPAAGDSAPAAEPKPAEPEGGKPEGGGTEPDDDVWSDFGDSAPTSFTEGLDESAVKTLAQRMGIEDPSKLDEAWEARERELAELRQRAEGRQFADEDLAQLQEIAAQGGDWRSHVNRDANIKGLEKNIESYKQVSGKDWMVWQLEKQAKEANLDPKKHVENVLGDMDESAIEAKGLEIGQAFIKQSEQQLNTLKQEQEQSATKAQEARQAWVAKASDAVKSYKDPHTQKGLGHADRETVARSLSSPLVRVSIPEEVHRLIADDKGNLDPAKMVDLLASQVTASKKIEYLTKRARRDARRQEFQKQSNADPNKPRSTQGQSDGGGGASNPIAEWNKSVERQRKGRVAKR